MGEVEAQHDVAVHALHEVQSAGQALHWVVVQLYHAGRIAVLVLEIGSECTVLGLVAHEVSGELHVPPRA